MACSGQGGNSRLPSETGRLSADNGMGWERALLLVGSGRPASDPVSTMFRCKDVRRGHANGDDGNWKLPACAVLRYARGKGRRASHVRLARHAWEWPQVPSTFRARRKHGYVVQEQCVHRGTPTWNGTAPVEYIGIAVDILLHIMTSVVSVSEDYELSINGYMDACPCHWIDDNCFSRWPDSKRAGFAKQWVKLARWHWHGMSCHVMSICHATVVVLDGTQRVTKARSRRAQQSFGPVCFGFFFLILATRR
jgi:hypothetical protein